MNHLVVVLGLSLVATGCVGSSKGGGGGSGGTTGGGGSGGATGGGGSGGSGMIVLGNQLCESTLALSGTFTPGSPPPADYDVGGCWPDGTWTFTATVTDNGTCPMQPPIPPMFTFKVVRDPVEYSDTITYENDPSNMFVATKISGGDGAICVGDFIIYSKDGKSIFNLRPALEANNVLDGQADWRLYDADQRN